MSKADDIKNVNQTISDAVASLTTSINNVSADIDRIKASLSGGLTAAEADVVILVAVAGWLMELQQRRQR